MNYLTLENVTRLYGDKVLFDRITLHVDKGQKAALVAKNGSGKSTLLRIIAGREGSEGEDAKVLLHREARIGVLWQDPELDERHSVIEAVFASENPILQAIRDYEEALLLPNKQDHLQAAMGRMEDLKAWDYEAKIKQILGKLNIRRLDQKVAELSGGQRKRVALAKVLIEEPDFLVLDEPTNHLDLDMIEWLEEYLQAPNLTLFMITHDRYFLDRVCNLIYELDEGSIHKYKGNYEYFLEKKALREDIAARTMDKDKKMLQRELEWVRRQPKARGTKAKARVDNFHDLKARTSQRRSDDELTLQVQGARMGKKIVEAHNISKRFGDTVIVKSFSYKFKRGEKVGIIGPNGAGKSTFIDLLIGQLPTDTGKVVIGDTITFGYYQQEGMKMAEDKMVIDVVRDIAEVIPLAKGQKLTASQLLERFLFPPAQQRVYVSQLSGGEKRRLYLLTILMANPNFLILDEPTNDLDILTLNVLEDFLQEFDGCLLIVTHDRYFMDKLVDHLFVFEGQGEIRDFNGTYAEYRLLKDLEEEEARQKVREQAKPLPEARPAPANTASALSFEQRKELRRLEKEVQKLEEQKASITAAFADPGIGPADIERLSKELAQVSAKLEEKEIRWMELAELDG